VEGEWLVLESTGTDGVHLARLGKRNVRVYRVEIATPEQRRKAVENTLFYEGSYYDWRLGFKLFYHGLVKLITKRRRLTAEDLSEAWYKHDKFFICTEAALRGYYDQGLYIVPPHVVPLPCSIKEAELQGIITLRKGF
jgi:hypothetical protein